MTWQHIIDIIAITGKGFIIFLTEDGYKTFPFIAYVLLIQHSISKDIQGTIFRKIGVLLSLIIGGFLPVFFLYRLPNAQLYALILYGVSLLFQIISNEKFVHYYLLSLAVFIYGYANQDTQTVLLILFFIQLTMMIIEKKLQTKK